MTVDGFRSWLEGLRRNAAGRRMAARPPSRSQQELCETAMALMTLWVSFDDDEHETVARTTRSLLAGLTTADLGYLVLHLAGLSRGLVHSMSDHSGPGDGLDVDRALRALAHGVARRGTAAQEDTD
ncbi:MAG TPA: hypothetical protein VFX70_07910 [Mycobacteriales bacterium]|nr:hypothetical protein [Mycobacteriales bacterium]